MLKGILLFLFSFSLAQAQLPQGKLYVHTYPTTGRTTGDLGYIDYVTLQYTGFDSLDITEMVHLQGRLYPPTNWQPGKTGWSSAVMFSRDFGCTT